MVAAGRGLGVWGPGGVTAWVGAEDGFCESLLKSALVCL